MRNGGWRAVCYCVMVGVGVYKWMDGGGWVGTLVEGCTGLCVDLRGVSFGGLDELWGGALL